MDPLVARFLAFLDDSPTPPHAVASVVKRAVVDCAAAVISGPTGRIQTSAGQTFVLPQDGSVFVVRVGQRPPEVAGFRIVAAHTDSPNLRVKPRPVQRAHGYVRIGVEVYGGAQVPTWVDRDLGMAGVVHVRSNGGIKSVLVDLKRPLCRVPSLAIHLNRGVNDEGLKLNAQTQLPAVLALSDEVAEDQDPLLPLLAEAAGCGAEDVVTWDLSLYDLSSAALGGASGEFIFSGRLDNLASCHAALEAFVAEGPTDATSVLAFFDHEEIGSRSNRGADGRAIERVLGRFTNDLDTALGRSFLLSADMSHAVHPAFADKSEGEHAPRMNGGPAIKQNVNQRYTTEGATSARFALLCEQAEVPFQWYVHRSDLACGSTVGPMLASRLGVRSVDVGNPMLSMHSVREQCGTHDHGRMVRVMGRFLADTAVLV